LALGDANPPYSVITVAPQVGAAAECGYTSDNLQVGCDAIVSDEYVAVRGSDPNLSTADAIVVLRAAVDYVRAVQ
jgi:hypothetical protein